MSLPLSTNTTCDIYRNGRSPGAGQAPDVVGVPIYLTADYERRMETGEGEGVNWRWTHVAFMDLAVDVRDQWDARQVVNQDVVYVPDQNGTPFTVKFVERRLGFKKVYLDRRNPPSWPTTEL